MAKFTPAAGDFSKELDWLSFTITALVLVTVYLITINPEVDLGDSGVYVTSGMYLGVPSPPGFALWTIYSHLFTILLPISTIAWRVNMASAVASSVACGTVAMAASRCGGMLLGELGDFRRLNPKDEKIVRVVCGCIAGFALGFDGMFWSHALVALPWNFNLLLFVVTLMVLLKWQHEQFRTKRFYLDCLAYGLLLSDTQSMLIAAPGFLFFALCPDTPLSRDICSLSAAGLVILLVGEHFNLLPDLMTKPLQIHYLAREYVVIASCLACIAAALIVKTRSFFVPWQTPLFGFAAFLLGLSPYFLLPVFSMTNPPMNWGYTRTTEGFVHLVNRGQYEFPAPARDFAALSHSVQAFLIKTGEDYGFVFLFVALVPFLFFPKLERCGRRTLLGLMGFALSLSVFMSYVLNASLDRGSLDMNGRLYTGAHLVFSILAGCGLVLIALVLHGKRVSSVKRDAG